jgi:hypothetical protein
VTGSSFGWPRNAQEYTTLKYDSEGNQLWSARYHYPLYQGDEPIALALAADGNVYVTGKACTESRIKGACTRYAYGTIKYDSQGQLLWATLYHAAGGDSLPLAIAVDAAGNAYVTGSCSFLPYPYPNPGSDYVTVKYDNNGNVVWVARYHGGKSRSLDGATAIAIDAQGNAYVTGGTGSGDPDRQYATIKYDTDGNELWVAQYPGRGGTALARDADGNVYVTGLTLYPSYNYLTIKYDSEGTEVWVARYETPERGTVYALAPDSAGNVYVTGGMGGQYATVKYDSKGNELWAARYHGPGPNGDVAFSIAIDGKDNAYVTGASSAIGGLWRTDYATIKYDPGGNEVWVARYHGLEDYADTAWRLALDAVGNVCVTGYSYFRSDFGRDAQFTTIKYSQ